jgi:hypothetical protein
MEKLQNETAMYTRLVYIDTLHKTYLTISFTLKKPTSIPGHFFNSEHSPYLFPMFNFKNHRSMHCELLCNQLYRTPEILK